MSDTIPDVISSPPFPELTWDEFYWKCPINLSSWTGFQTRGGAYSSVNCDEPSDGTVLLTIGTDEGTRRRPDVGQVTAYEYLLAYQHEITHEILSRILDAYPSWRQSYDGLIDPEDMPPIQGPGDLKSLIGLSIVHILSKSQNGIAYVGFEIGCTWDEEHGLGAMTHENRIVELGNADTAFDENILDNDE